MSELLRETKKRLASREKAQLISVFLKFLFNIFVVLYIFEVMFAIQVALKNGFAPSFLFWQ